MSTLKILLTGDVMLGRGIDQILRHPSPPELFEQHIGSATEYVTLAERVHGPIPKRVEPDYVWGEGLEELEFARPALRIVNLETAITRSSKAWAKGINYRMSPENAECLIAAKIACCVLANNHVLDWGRTGLGETLRVLDRLNIKVAGAGVTLEAARALAAFEVGERGRLVVFASATSCSGVPIAWAANWAQAGVNLLPDLSDRTVDAIADHIRATTLPNDVAIVSIHWGNNWGYDVPAEQRRFAHALVDKANVAIVHGHSSHHAKAVELYRGRLILYGCGDLLNDYEGIAGREAFRNDLALMYFATIDMAKAEVVTLEMTPFQIRRFQLLRASRQDAERLCAELDRESRKFGTRIALADRGTLRASF